MKNWLLEILRVLAPILIVSLGVGGFMILGKPPAVRNEIPDKALPAVETVAAVLSPGTLTIEVEGVAAPFRQVTISAEVEGRVVKKLPLSRAGSYVSAGDPLLQIDPVDYRLEVDRLTARVNQSRAELDAIEVQIGNNEKLVAIVTEEQELNRRELDRAQQLFQRRVIPDSQLDATLGTELASRRSLQTLQNEGAVLLERKRSQHASLTLAEAELARAAEDLKRTDIKSPLDGVIVTDNTELDNFVKRGDPLLKISDSRRLEIMTSLTVDELYWVWMNSGLLSESSKKTDKERMELPRTDVEAVFDLHGTKYKWQGQLSRYEGSGLDARTRTVPCRVLVENPTQVQVISNAGVRTQVSQSTSAKTDSLPAMYVGMYLTIRIPVHSPIPLMEIPTESLRPGNEIWLVREGKLRIVKSDVMRREHRKIYVRLTAEGIQPGDHVITSPLSYVADGLSIREIAPETAETPQLSDTDRLEKPREVSGQ